MQTRNYWKRVIAAAVFSVAAAAGSFAQTFTVIKRFNGTDGGSPMTPLLEGTDGNLYGTAVGGGSTLTGTFFRLTRAGSFTTIHNFCTAPACADGASPMGALAEGLDGSLYGNTADGGRHVGGAVFRLDPQSGVTNLVSFCALVSCADGANPRAGVVQGFDGNFYGTTLMGGANGDHGTVFQMAPDGGASRTILHSFCAQADCADGESPYAGLIQATDGNFYGGTSSSGAGGGGTIFRISPAGTLTTLYSFCATADCSDGNSPRSGVIQGADGNFYGVTPAGGLAGSCRSGCGTVFKLTPDGSLTTLYRFSASDGALPVALLQATDGNFYGTTQRGGAHGQGTVFQITPEGALTTLHSFDASEGDRPGTGLTQTTDGSFYGTTTGGGSGNQGSIFRLSVGLGPFVETLPKAAVVGQTVKIHGTHLTDATQVTFNGIPAGFKVISAALIVSIVPAGATTGPVRVITPAGTLSGNTFFQVLPGSAQR